MEIEKLKLDTEKLAPEIDKLKLEKESLHRENDSLHRDKESLRRERKPLDAMIAGLTAQLRQHEATIAVQKQIQDLESECKAAALRIASAPVQGPKPEAQDECQRNETWEADRKTLLAQLNEANKKTELVLRKSKALFASSASTIVVVVRQYKVGCAATLWPFLPPYRQVADVAGADGEE